MAQTLAASLALCLIAHQPAISGPPVHGSTPDVRKNSKTMQRPSEDEAEKTPTRASPPEAWRGRPGARRVEFELTGTTCLSCVTKVEKQLKETVGVLEVARLLPYPPKLSVIYQSRDIDLEKLLEVARFGKYGTKNVMDDPADKVRLVPFPRDSRSLSGMRDVPELEPPPYSY